jgi:hypothetical protein
MVAEQSRVVMEDGKSIPISTDFRQSDLPYGPQKGGDVDRLDRNKFRQPEGFTGSFGLRERLMVN